MFSLFRKRPTKRFVAFVPPKTRLYVVGDIHGRADLLDRLARKIEVDIESAPPTVLTVFLGDYIDRGLQSSAVVQRLATRDFPTAFEALKGNHEQAMLEALGDEKAFDFWRRIGGVQTLASYGTPIEDVSKGHGFIQAHAQFLRCVPRAHIDFLTNLSTRKQVGDYFFCHAGVKPGMPLHEQRESDLISIRDEFLTSPLYHGKMIVHGHTPVEEPDFRYNRINIDTGAYLTNRLTCLVLEAESVRTIEA